MARFRVWLPEQERIIDAETDGDAMEIFKADDGVFDFLEVEPAAPVEVGSDADDDDIPY